MRARCRARARLDRSGGLAVADGLRVGVLDLRGEIEFGVSEQAVSDPDAAALLPARRAGGDLQPADLLGRQRGLREGVVLLAPEQDPEQACELARGGGDGDLVAVAGADAAVAGAQRAWLADGAPAGLHQRDPDRGRAVLGDVPVRGGRVAGLADLGV